MHLWKPLGANTGSGSLSRWGVGPWLLWVYSPCVRVEAPTTGTNAPPSAPYGSTQEH